MVLGTLAAGILLGFLYYELVGLSPGGIIVPGYIALFINQPVRLVSTLVVSIITYFIIELLARCMILFGRRRFAVTIVTGFCIKWLLETAIINMITLEQISVDLRAIGYLIPGLIANDISRQGFWKTLVSLVIVSSLVYLVSILFR